MMKNKLKPAQKPFKTKLLQNLHCCNLYWFFNETRKWKLSSRQCKFRLKKKKDTDLFDDELEDSSDESEIELNELNDLCFSRC